MIYGDAVAYDGGEINLDLNIDSGDIDLNLQIDGGELGVFMPLPVVGTIVIEENGLHDVKEYAYANVNVPTGIDGNDLAYGSASCLVGTAKVGTAYVWTDYDGGNIAIINKAVVGTSVAV